MSKTQPQNSKAIKATDELSLPASIFAAPDYRAFLKSVLALLKSRNSQYSLRAFAMKLELPAGFLSQILSGSRNLSSANALKVARLLQLKTEEAHIFVKMVELELTTDESLKGKLRGEIESMQTKISRIDIDIQRFQTLSEWYAIPILEMMSSPIYQTNPEQVALDLGIPHIQVEQCLEKLTSLNLLTKQTQEDQSVVFKKAESYTLIFSPTDQLAIKRFNAHMLDRMKRALYEQTPQERYSGSETLMIDPTQLPEATEILNKCLDDLVILFSKGQNKTHIYHAAFHMISLRRKALKLSTGDES